MTGPDKQLAALRAEIDAVDSQLHDLLMRRTDLAVQVGEVKARVQPLGGTPADGSKFIRPAREALILRRLVARHQGKLPKAVIVRMWREMISALLQVEGPFVVAVQAPKGDTALWDLARDHYGSRVAHHAGGRQRRRAERGRARQGDGRHPAHAQAGRAQPLVAAAAGQAAKAFRMSWAACRSAISAMCAIPRPRRW